jgi:hypothetical protein
MNSHAVAQFRGCLQKRSNSAPLSGKYHKSSNELSELTTDEESIKYKHPMTDVYNQTKALE